MNRWLTVKPKSVLFLLTLYSALSFSPVVWSAFQIRILGSTHDGYCFYHAVATLLGSDYSGPALYHQLRQYLSNSSAVSDPQLDNLLHHELIGSSIYKLTEQLQTHEPSLTSSQSWAGYPEAVALSQMLGLPILVIHISSSLQVTESSSFLLDGLDIHPLSALIDSHHPVPQLQLILSGDEWNLIEIQTPASQWPDSLNNYIQQLTEIINEQLPNISDAYSQPSENEMSAGWISEQGLLHGSDHLMLDYGSLAAMQRIEFSSRLNIVMKKYTKTKNIFDDIRAEQRDIYSPEFTLDEERLSMLNWMIDSLSAILVNGFVKTTIGPLMGEYLRSVRLQLKDFIQSLIPSVRGLWEVITMLRPVVDQVCHNGEGLNFAGTISSSFHMLQCTGETGVEAFDLRGQHRPVLPSGRQQPESIGITRGARVIAFDRNNPLHHILFALYIIDRTYHIANQCLSLSKQASPEYLRRFLQVRSTAVARHLIELQQRQHSNIHDRISALIHALGRHYYPDIWRDDHYQTITICDGDFIVFHSDDMQPRGGWQDLFPPEYLNPEVTAEEWESILNDTPPPPEIPEADQGDWDILSLEGEEEAKTDPATDQ